MTDWRTDKPQGSDSPTDLDTIIQTQQEGIRERLDVDHVAELSGNYVLDITAGAGKHRKVQFESALSTNPTILTGEAALFTKEVSGISEIFCITESLSGGRQLTSGAKLNIEDGDISGFADESTITFSGSKFVVNTPTAGADIAVSGNAIFGVGSYTGDGTDTFSVNVGFKPHFMIIRRESGSYKHILLINEDNTNFVAFTPEPNDHNNFITPTDSGVNIDISGDSTQKAKYNASGVVYYFYALGGPS